MSLNVIHLRKLLKFCSLNDERARSALRREAYEDMRRLENPTEGGGDFHAPFWRDAKNHVCHGMSLEDATEIRVERNYRRGRLYPLMKDAFLDWWLEMQRSTNETLRPVEENVHARQVFEDLGITVKVDNLLSLQLGHDRHRLIYPYFSEEPAISETWARVGLWMIGETLSDWDVDDAVLLDLHRRRSFSTSTHQLRGNEQALLQRRVHDLREMWNEAMTMV